MMANNNSKTINEKININNTSILSNRAILVILSSNFLGKTFVINKPETIIGRQEDCDISINDPSISKKHCSIIYNEKDDNFYLEDLGSMNFTFINDKQVKKKEPLFYSDRIIIGKTIIRFFLEEKIV